MPTEPAVLVETFAEGFALVALSRPRAPNSLSRESMTALTEAIDALEADPEVRALILTGAGRAFCAGPDLKELGRGEQRIGDMMQPAGRPDPVRALERFRGPVIGAVDGAAVAGGKR